MATQQQNKTQGKGNVQANIPAQELEAQNRYWREHFQSEPYYTQGKDFSAYEPAYRLGIEARNEYPNKQFSEVEDKLRMQYEAKQQDQRKLDWAEAKQAVRAAWDRGEQTLLGSDAAKPSRH